MNKMPKLRFKEFSGEWNHKKLNEIIERVTRKNKGNISNLPLTISAQYGLIDQEKFFNKTVASKNLESYYLLENGEFAYNKSYSNGYPWGAIKRLDKYNMGVLSSLYICFKEKKGINSDYLTHYFETTKWYKEISMIAVEGARNHGLLNISVSDFFDTLHYIPCYEEQQKIVNFLSLIDKKIQKQQEKVEAFKDYKKGMMQKIFSQEIRFKEFSGEEYGEWEEKKLSEVSQYTSSNVSMISLEEFNGEKKYPIYNANQIYMYIDKFDSKEPYISIIKDGAGVGRLFLCEAKSSVIGTMGYIKPSNNCLLGFLYYRLQLINFIKYINGSTIPHVYYKDYKHAILYLPCLEEQQKIANFLFTLDKKLKKEQERLDSLNQWKKGLLQQMFV